MKSIITFFAIVALSCAASAFAQEESPSPATGKEKASATVEETPAATVAPEIKSTPAAEVKPATSPAAEKKAAASPAKAASPAADARPAKKMSVRDMEEKLEASVPSHDFSTVQGFVAADFMGVSSQGKFVERNGFLAEFKNDKDTYKSAKNERLNVRNFG